MYLIVIVYSFKKKTEHSLMFIVFFSHTYPARLHVAYDMIQLIEYHCGSCVRRVTLSSYSSFIVCTDVKRVADTKDYFIRH